MRKNEPEFIGHESVWLETLFSAQMIIAIAARQFMRELTRPLRKFIATLEP